MNTTKDTTDMCAGHCDSGRAGHTVLPIQERVASASPNGWRDAIIERVDNDGVATIVFLDDASSTSVWTHSSTFAPNEPVALHKVGGLLAIGGQLVSVTG